MSDNLSGFLGNCEAIPKRVMPIFFLIDTSGSMEGKKIGQVNAAIEEMIPELRDISDSQSDSEIKMAVMKFSTGCEWVTPSLMSLDAFDDWEPLEAEGLTDLGAAFQELNSKLSKDGFMNRSSASSGFHQPVFILLSDGEPTDDWVTALKQLQQNKWYKSSIKIAIAIGDDANCDVLKKAIKNPELLFNVSNVGNLKKVIHFIAVTSSQIASTSAAVTNDNVNKPADITDVAPVAAEQAIAGAIKNAMKEEDSGMSTVSIQATVPSAEPEPVAPVSDAPAFTADVTPSVIPADEEDW